MYSCRAFNVTVPLQNPPTAAQCSFNMRAIKQRHRTTQVGVNGGALPCIRLACATCGYCVTNEPHLSLQHYELNAKQHMLDRTRVLVSGQWGPQAWGKSLRRLNEKRRSDPCLIDCNNMTNLVSKTEGGREGKIYVSLQQVLTALYNRPLQWTLNSLFELTCMWLD